MFIDSRRVSSSREGISPISLKNQDVDMSEADLNPFA
jgi:hypothetical protein